MINAIPETQGLVTFNNWFNVLFLPMVLTTVILIAGSLLFLRPKESLSKEAVDALKKQPILKMGRNEVIACIILVVVFIMFLSGQIHGLPDAAICLAAVFMLFLLGVLDPKDINVGVNWDLVVFFGISFSLGPMFIDAGISEWLSGIVVPALAPIAGSPWSFMLGTMVFMFIWRFFDVAAFVPTIAIIVPILPAIHEAYQIDPLVWLVLFVMAANCFFMTYQNVWAVMSRSIAGDRAWGSKHLGVYGGLYFVACMLALTATIPIWTRAGLFG
jgi:di/tricarboxylate transporter